MQDHQMFPGRRRADRDGPRNAPVPCNAPVDVGVIDFAAWLVALLATRKSAADPVLRADLLAAFHAAAIEQTPDAMQAFLRDLVRQKISAATVADLYIPALARRLGDGWLDDRVSFIEVTLASSRMQAMLRAPSGRRGPPIWPDRGRGRRWFWWCRHGNSTPWGRWCCWGSCGGWASRSA